MNAGTFNIGKDQQLNKESFNRSKTYMGKNFQNSGNALPPFMKQGKNGRLKLSTKEMQKLELPKQVPSKMLEELGLQLEYKVVPKRT